MIRMLLALALLPAAALADEVFLKGAGKVSGRIVERTETSVTVDVGGGTVTVPMSHVERIEEGRSALQVYEERAARLDARDREGWLALADAAAAQGLNTQARQAYERVLAIAPDDPAANAALGRVQLGGRWVTEEESYRAQGYVQFEGEWMTPAEQQALLQERSASDAEERRAAAEQRAREAEARAEEAEARAREAEAEAQEGLPLWWGAWGPGPTYWPTAPVRPVQLPARTPR